MSHPTSEPSYNQILLNFYCYKQKRWEKNCYDYRGSHLNDHEITLRTKKKLVKSSRLFKGIKVHAYSPNFKNVNESLKKNSNSKMKNLLATR